MWHIQDATAGPSPPADQLPSMRRGDEWKLLLAPLFVALPMPKPIKQYPDRFSSSNISSLRTHALLLFIDRPHLTNVGDYIRIPVVKTLLLNPFLACVVRGSNQAIVTVTVLLQPRQVVHASRDVLLHVARIRYSESSCRLRH